MNFWASEESNRITSEFFFGKERVQGPKAGTKFELDKRLDGPDGLNLDVAVPMSDAPDI